MKTEFRRIPLEVLAVFTTDGSFRPRALRYHDTVLEITRVVGTRRRSPRVVPCVAPMEYAVIIDGAERCIYYEADTNTWFSVKEVLLDDEDADDFAQ